MTKKSLWTQVQEGLNGEGWITSYDKWPGNWIEFRLGYNPSEGRVREAYKFLISKTKGNLEMGEIDMLLTMNRYKHDKKNKNGIYQVIEKVAKQNNLNLIK